MNNIDNTIKDYNKVKDLVLNKLIMEDLIDKDDAEEFSERCQVILYKPSWFERFTRKHNPKAIVNNYYLRIIEMIEKEDAVKKMMRKTNSNYNEDDYNQYS